MTEHSTVVKAIELKLKQAIEGQITTTMKTAEMEKAKYMKSVENISELSNKINGYLEKFDKIKEEMD
jgi:hypothetical protein